MGLQVLKIEIDRNSGHITAQVRATEKASSGGGTTFGPVVTEGISHDALTQAYQCPSPATPAEVEAAIMRWLGRRHTVLLAQKQALDERSTVVGTFRGKTLEFPA
jgi:hypothetical protein